MKPIIILGAGASHDYVNTDHRTGNPDWTPPLSDGLFNTKVYHSIITKYSEVNDLSSDALTRVPGQMSLENYLTNIKNTIAATNHNRQKQLVSLGFYLQHLFREISANYGSQPGNNYRVLVQRIKDSGGEACIVSFNYDTLLEENVDTINVYLSSYIQGPIKIIKPHGSCDWVYGLQEWSGEIDLSYNFLMQNPWHLTFPGKVSSEPFERRRNLRGPVSYLERENGSTIHLLPALAIPLFSKEKYVCPLLHVKELEEAFKSTDRILIIGWRGMDSNLIELINKISYRISITIVSSSIKSAEAFQAKLKNPNLFIEIPKNQGFTQFLRSPESDKFFQ